MSSAARFSPKIGMWALGALVVAAVLGLVGQSQDVAFIFSLSALTEPLGVVWINALQMTVIPLIVTQLLAALVRPDAGASVGRLGTQALALFLGVLFVGNVITILVTNPMMAYYIVSPEVVAGLTVESIPESARIATQQGPQGLGDWLIGLVPTNPVAAFADGNILQILVFTILSGLAISRLPAAERLPIGRAIHGLADAMMILIGWVLWGTPIGVFALILSVTLATGLGSMSLVLWFIVGLSALLIVATILLYPLTAFFGRTTMGRFAEAAAPAQLVALGTRSSLASLPALIQGGRDRMHLPESATGFVLPLCAATFKMNQAISPIYRFILLAHFYGVSLTLGDYATFVSVSILLSFGVVGVPRGGGGGFKYLPLYLAAGIPIEGFVVLEVVKTIPDFFMTTLNVTANMSVATVLSRDTRTNPAIPGHPVVAPPPGLAVETER